MCWSDTAPSLIALLGIPVGLFLAWWRDDRVRERQEQREDARRFVAERMKAYDELICAGNTWWSAIVS